MRKIYYVDATNGSDLNTGLTIETPWKSLKRVEMHCFEYGDSILLKSGEVWKEGLKLQGMGKKGEPICLSSYLVEGDTVKRGVGTKPRIEAEGQVRYAIHLHNLAFWEIENIEVSNKGKEPEAGRTGIVVSADDNFCGDDPHYIEHIYLKNVFVHDVNGEPTIKDSDNGGIYYSILTEDTTNYLAFRDIRIENCYVKDVQRTGISFGGTKCAPKIVGDNLSVWEPDVIRPYLHQDIIIRNNYVERSGGDAIVPMYAFRPLIEHNTSQEASYSTRDNTQLMFNAGIWPWQCYEAVFRYNEAFKTYLNGDGQGFDCDWSYGTVYEHNYSHHNEGGFMLVCKENAIAATVRHNISYNDQRCLFMHSNVKEACFEGNLFYTGKHLDTQIFSEDHGPAIFRRNIFYKEGGVLEVDWHEEDNTYLDNSYSGYSHIVEDRPEEINKKQMAYINEVQIWEDMLNSIEIDIQHMLEQENQKRAMAKLEGNTVYGIEQFTLEQFRSYIDCYEDLIKCEKFINEQGIDEKSIEDYYDEVKLKAYKKGDEDYFYPLKLVKDHIKHKIANGKIATDKACEIL